MENETTIEEKLTILTKRLNKLEIAQSNIVKELKETKESIREIENTKEKKNDKEDRTKSYQEYEKRNFFEIGDKIKIKNPTKHNEVTGIVTGTTQKGYVTFITETGRKTRRLPLNLTITKKKDEK